jgi:hypothetical protein
VALITYEAIVIYSWVMLVYDLRIFALLAFLPPFFVFRGVKKERQYFTDVSLPVVKTVGTLKTIEIKRRRSTEKYLEIENVRFDGNNNDHSVINLMFSTFGKNRHHFPIRIEYSPHNKLIWEIKKRSQNGSYWESIYDVLPESKDLREEFLIQSQLSPNSQSTP